MALVTTQTPNFIGGVSQQPAALRFPNQAEAQENAVGTVTEGLKKRPCAEHIGLLPSAPTGEALWHTINRDASEQYMVSVADEDLRVFDLADGSSETIYDINGDVAVTADFSYLNLTDADDIEALTLADFTIVVNKSIQPKMNAATTTTRKPEALVFVKAGNYGTKYTVSYVSGGSSGKVVFETPLGDAAEDISHIQTDHIAEGLETAMSTGATGLFTELTITGTWPIPNSTVAREGSTVWIQRDNTTDFTIKGDDSVGSSTLIVIKDEVQTFVDLPVVAPNGFLVKIDGLPDQGGGGSVAYYAAFETTSDTTTGDAGVAAFEDGVWEESVAGGIQYKVDYATMPHILVRLSDGNFLWTQLDGVALNTAGGLPAFTPPKWGEIEAGDADTNGRPSWLAASDGTGGELIRGMSFFADRLVFLSGQDISLSESGQYFNWFRTTVTSLLDSARIGVTAAHTNVNLLNFAVPMREQLTVFSQFTQFALRGSQDGTLTPTNVWVTAATEYETSLTVRPVSSKRSIFAAAPRGSATLIRELYDSGTTARPQFDSVEITAQIPTYLQGAAKRIAISSIEDMIVVLVQPPGGAVKSTLYTFKYLINGDERVQSAWSKYTFGGTTADIVHFDWIDQDLYTVVVRGAQVSLERLNFEAYLKDTDSTFKVLLDRRVNEADCTVVYDSSADQTTFTLPYTISTGAAMEAMTREGENLVPSDDDAFTQWVPSSMTIKEDHGKTGPFGTGKAYYWHGADGASAAEHNAYIVYRFWTPDGTQLTDGQYYTWSCYVRNYDAEHTLFYFWDHEAPTETGSSVTITWASATEGADVDSVALGGYGVHSETHAEIGGGWWRVTMTILYDASHVPGDQYIAAEIQMESHNDESERGVYLWGPKVVTGEEADAYAGLALPVTSSTGSDIVVSGNYATTPVWLGEQYQMRYQFSELGLRSAYYGGASSRPVPSAASFRPRYGNILFEESAYFKVRVTPKNQTAYEYPMTGKILSSGEALVGSIGLESGNFRFPLMGGYQDITIEVLNDSPLPSRLIAAEWESQYHTRNRRY